MEVSNNMFLFFEQTSSFFIFLSIILCFPCSFPARSFPGQQGMVKVSDVDGANLQWHGFSRFTNASPGCQISGLSKIKKYFHQFGYLHPRLGSNFTDEYDTEFESAVVSYQTRLGLPITGHLDPDTISSFMSPRCGVRDTSPGSAHAKLFHATQHYTFYEGMPRWERPKPVRLTYAVSPDHMIDKLSLDSIRAAFGRAFARWAQVIPVEFEESSDYETADVRIGFYTGDHGDGQPFDGVLRVLAHSFLPEDGRLHLDGAETWSLDFRNEAAPAAVDLESVATHEIGHILGLGHSSVKSAVMYPTLKPRTTKVDLDVDDVEGVQTLYGTSPNFEFNTPMSRQTERVSNNAVGQWSKIPTGLTITVSAMLFALSSLSL